MDRQCQVCVTFALTSSPYGQTVSGVSQCVIAFLVYTKFKVRLTHSLVLDLFLLVSLMSMVEWSITVLGLLIAATVDVQSFVW